MAVKRLKKDVEPVADPVSPGFYFNALKDKKQKISDATLEGIYDNCLILLEKYEKTGQLDAMKKLLFHIDTIEKERAVLAAGLDTFVYLSDVQNYVEKVQDRVVKIIELERYEREVPDEVIAIYEKVKGIFTKFFVVFTDYTKEHVDKSKKERDPILFGMFQDKALKANSERLYFIGDWEDEYCDLTLDRLVSEMKTLQPKDVVSFTVRDPKTLDDIRAKLKALEDEKRDSRMTMSNVVYMNNSSNIGVGVDGTSQDVKRPSFFKKVRTALGLK